YRVVVTDATGNTNSAAAHLTVLIPATLFISQSAPGFVTLSWTGSMGLLEVELSTSGLIDAYMIANVSPVTLPIRAEGRFFRLVAPETVDFRGALDRCHSHIPEACEECVKDYFISTPGPWQPSSDAETAAAIGVELGSTYCAAAETWLLELRNGIQ